MSKNLWVLTEERPKADGDALIVIEFSRARNFVAFVDTIRIIPVIEKSKFCFVYEVLGFRSNAVDKVFIKTISGESSMVDFLVFYQDSEPCQTDVPALAIEETKTDDSESRNTGVYQRCSKFVFLKNIYPSTPCVMLFHLSVKQKETPTRTYIFGIRLLLTLGIKILGKSHPPKIFKKFTSIDEIIAEKNAMPAPPAKSNVPIRITKTTDKIKISGRLLKNGSLAHDPNIGALTIIAATLRTLGWTGAIEITNHGLSQNHIKAKNKFVTIALAEGITLEKLKLPKSSPPNKYWHYEQKGEKLGTIFIHLVTENFSNTCAIFENHAGCEKGYFIPPNNAEPIPLKKYTDRQRYKSGEKDCIVNIPDLVLLDLTNAIVIDVEGKKYEFRKNGIKELSGYDAFDKLYTKKYYPKFKITRTVVLFGSDEVKIQEIKVGFLLNNSGKLILGIKAPTTFKTAIKNLLSFWKNQSPEK